MTYDNLHSVVHYRSKNSDSDMLHVYFSCKTIIVVEVEVNRSSPL